MTYSASSGQKKNDKQINSGQHHDILSQLRSWCCPLFICLSFFFWSELAEYVTVLSTVYVFVIFLLAGAG
jgi:uncharacterized membrane protein YccC